MSMKLGYLLPTRERIMHGQPDAAPILALADRAENMAFDSVWIGDSLLARPRHDPITMLAAIAARTTKVELGTAVLLPALRNPVVLAHQFATLDQISQGRVILGVGIAADVPNIRAEFAAAGVPFEKRVGRMMEGLRLCQAFWRGEPVDWEGRWPVQQGVLAPTPHRPGGPPIWGGGSVPASLTRAGKNFDGWFPTGPDAAGWGEQWQVVREAAKEAGRNADDLTGALYLTMVIDDDADRAQSQINAYLEEYYGVAAAVMTARQA
ncbi:MAG: LLM class flavin-dependent oxidoreductase, partial [Alphaproteobacteria bacterium]|nr:LLM class flavin-dependent oxidoreductase [Alphaproteobacteria bacterium]